MTAPPAASRELALAFSRSCLEPQREIQKMPLLFYFPLIIWMGMLGAMQDEMRMPVTAKARR